MKSNISILAILFVFFISCNEKKQESSVKMEWGKERVEV